MRLLNALFEDETFLVDEESVPYIVRDIINMNWWNTCDYLLGYQKNRRVSLTPPTREMKLIGIITKEFYRHYQNSFKDVEKFEKEMCDYIIGKAKCLRQLKLFSMDYRRNDSQYFYKHGKPTWLDCTSRATYAWKYIAQNGYVDFDGKVRVIDGYKFIEHIDNASVYPHKDEAKALFAKGENSVKKEIFSQRKVQNTVSEWVERLGIKVMRERGWLYDLVYYVRTDPYKNYEKYLFNVGHLKGNNEALYGYYTTATIKNKKSFLSRASYASVVSGASDASYASSASSASSAGGASRTSDASYASRASRASVVSGASYVSSASDASYVSRASGASSASNASNASSASDASGASYVSSASSASHTSSASSAGGASSTSDARHESRARAAGVISDASDASDVSTASDAGVISVKKQAYKITSWYDVPTAIGELEGLDHPPVFKKDKFGTAGHWKINDELVKACAAWIDPFMGWGETPLYAKKMNKKFVGIDINPDTMNGYILPYIQKVIDKARPCNNGRLFQHLTENQPVKIIHGDSAKFDKNLVNSFDLCYTSPPYFDFEDYGFHNKEIQNSKDYDEFHKRVTIPVFTNVYKYLTDDGILALQTEKDKTLKEKWIDVIQSMGYVLIKDNITGREKNKYSMMSKRDQTLLIFRKE